MLLFPARFLALTLLLSAPVLGEDTLPAPSPHDVAAQNLAIAASVQEQLLACWSLPAGYEDRSISVRLAFMGDGTLDGDPYVEPGSIRTAGKYPALMQSVVRAIQRCIPFAGLETLGAQPHERFDITVHFRS